MSARVKICGVNSAEAIDAAVAAAADWIGFVFFPPSPRFVTAAGVADLCGRHARLPPRVGLFVEPSDDEIAAVLARVPLDVLQLYAPASRIAAVRARFGRPVWRAVGVATAGDLPRDAGEADALVIEAKPPPGATRPGGNAQALDWSMLAGWSAPGPWLLAGGLTAETVGEAIRMSGAPAVDVSSGVERRPGVKDAEMVRRFVSAVRAAG